MGVEPTKLTAETFGWVRIASTATLSPCTTLKTPSGRPASLSSSARRSDVDGSRSEGLRMKVLPQAIATGNIHIGTIAGKLKGVIPAQTPSGWRIEYRSMPAEILSENSPFMRCGMPQANSTTSRPRWIEPLASESTLPCSDAMRSASSSMWRSISSLKRNITRARVSGEVSDQPAKASFATAIARSTSALEARGTLAASAPVVGLNTSPKRPPFSPRTCLPPMKWVSSWAFVRTASRVFMESLVEARPRKRSQGTMIVSFTLCHNLSVDGGRRCEGVGTAACCSIALRGFPVLCGLHQRFEGAAALEQRALERRLERLLYAGLVERHPVLAHRLHQPPDFARGVRRGMHDHQPVHGKGVVGHVAGFALRVAHPQRQRPVGEVELRQIRVVLPEQAVEQRGSRLDVDGHGRPHPVAVEFGAQGLRCDDRAAFAALGELPDDDPGRLGIDPQQNAVRRLVDAPFRLVVPERIGKLTRRQAVAECRLQPDQVHPLALHVFDAVLAAEHEEREIQSGEHVGRELREVRVLERRRRILMPAAPQQPRRQAAPQRRIAEEAVPAAVEGRLVCGRSRRTHALQLERHLGSHALDLLAKVRQIVLSRRGAARKERGREQERAARREEPGDRHRASAWASGNWRAGGR